MNGQFRAPLLGLLVLVIAAAAPGQTAAPPATTAPPPPAPAAARDTRLAPLDRSINQHLDAGRIAAAVPPAREELDLLERRLGTDHWRAGDARRALETYTRLADQPGEVQDRYFKARQANARGEQLYGRGQYAKAALLFQEALTIRRAYLCWVLPFLVPLLLDVRLRRERSAGCSTLLLS
jgi:hypothetical protein